MLNYEMCQRYDVTVRGVILNKVKPEKRDMLAEYFPKALARYNLPLFGLVPDLPTLAYPSMIDFEGLFNTSLLCGQDRRLQTYAFNSLVTSGLRRFLKKLTSGDYDSTLFITHASRNGRHCYYHGS